MSLSNSHLPQQPAPCFRVCKPEPEAVEAGGETPRRATATELMKRWAELQGHTLEGGLPCFSPYETRHHDPCDGSLCNQPSSYAYSCASSRVLLLHLLRRSNYLRSDPLRHFPLSCCACIALPVSLTCRFFCGNHFCNTNHHQSQFCNDSKST